MLDTSFLIRLLKEDDSLHASAKEYFQYFLENNYVLYVSTVAVAEYCVRGELNQLPFECVRVVPFNLDHAEKAGDYAHTLYQAKDKGQYKPEQRLIIPNDTKLFAQASFLLLTGYCEDLSKVFGLILGFGQSAILDFSTHQYNA